jgi:hypothetical protein
MLGIYSNMGSHTVTLTMVRYTLQYSHHIHSQVVTAHSQLCYVNYDTLLTMLSWRLLRAIPVLT